jgi:hypothetical protein
MKSFFTFLLLFLFLSGSVFAKKVEVEDAQKAALAFVNHLDQLDKSTLSLELVYTGSELPSPFLVNREIETPYYYVFNFSNSSGYIIMSADDAVVPVLAYSTQKAYRHENQADAFVKWMDKYRREIKEIIEKKMPAGEKISEQWQRLKSGMSLKEQKNTEVVNPLVSTTWDQMQYYHDLCPYDYDYNEHVATGCVATAMAQVMKYHNHPQNGEGYHTYNHSKYGSLSANFGAETYNWSAMPADVNSTNNAVATLMYHCGVSLEMNYGPADEGGSSTNSLDVVANALKSYFSYSSSTQFTMRENYSDANWKNLLKNELNNSRPMEYAGIGQGGGHAFVCDGYDANDYFHFNWGWSGYYDGYFHMDQLNPGTGGTGAGAGNYNQYQQIVYGIEPEEGTGGGGGGGTPPGEGSPIELYSSITVNPNPIDFYSPFTVSVNIANLSGADYTCDVTAAIFNSDGAHVGFVNTFSNQNLLNNNSYSAEFTAEEGLPITPGQYSIGIYTKGSGGEWQAVKNGSYNNNVTITINGPQNDIQLYSDVSINPNPIVQGQSLSVSVNIANFGSYFNGTVSADFYTAQGEYLGEIQALQAELSNGTYGTGTFETSNVDLDPGTYIIAFWETTDGSNWNLIGSTSDYPNPITVKIVAPGIQPDPYENNDTEANAYQMNASNGGHFYTDGSTTHIGSDYDYYQFNLDPNYKYELVARVHDSYESANGNTYTNDVIFSYNEGTGAGEGYDSQAPLIVVNGKSNIKFFVASYFSGQTGTYLLDVNITKKGPAGIEEMLARDGFNFYPNPAQDILYLEVEKFEDLHIQEVSIYNAFGQIVRTIDLSELSADITKIDISNLENGMYFMVVKDQGGTINHKFQVIR